MTREDILNKAAECVCRDRNNTYGSPEDSFNVIANLWTDYLFTKDDPMDITARDVAAMLALLKIARIANGQYHPDNWIDLAGYAACGGEIDG